MKWSQIKIRPGSAWIEGNAAKAYILKTFGEYFSTKFQSAPLLKATCVEGKPVSCKQTTGAQPIGEVLSELLGADNVEVEGYEPPKPQQPQQPQALPQAPRRMLDLAPSSIPQAPLFELVSLSGRRATPNVVDGTGPCKGRACFDGTTIGLEWETDDVQAKTHADKPLVIETVMRAPGSKWPLLSITRDIYHGRDKVAVGTLELITGPIVAQDEKSWEQLKAMLRAFAKACVVEFSSAPTILGSAVAQHAANATGLELKVGAQRDAIKPRLEEKKRAVEDDEDWDTSDEPQQEAPVRISFADLRGTESSPEERLKLEPQLVNNSNTGLTPSLSASAQVNIGVQLAQLGTANTGAYNLLSVVLDGSLAYASCVGAAPTYWTATGLTSLPTPALYGVLVVYATMVNKLTDTLRNQQYVLTATKVADREFSDPTYKNSWGALPKIVPAQLWTAVPQAGAYKAYVDGNLDAAAATFAQHFIANANERAVAADVFKAIWGNAAFSPAPKPVKWFCIKSSPAVVFELRTSGDITNAFTLLDGGIQDLGEMAKKLVLLGDIAK